MKPWLATIYAAGERRVNMDGEGEEPPELIKAVGDILEEAAYWFYWLVPAAILFSLLIGAFLMIINHDPAKKREIKDRFQNVILGAIGSGAVVWFTNWLWGKFSGIE